MYFQRPPRDSASGLYGNGSYFTPQACKALQYFRILLELSDVQSGQQSYNLCWFIRDTSSQVVLRHTAFSEHVLILLILRRRNCGRWASIACLTSDGCAEFNLAALKLPLEHVMYNHFALKLSKRVLQ